MVIVKLIGGLGNQLFQYAAGRRLAHRLNVPFKLDVSPFETYTLRSYKLSHFSVIEEFASKSEIAGFEPFYHSKKRRVINALCKYVAPARRKLVFTESTLEPVKQEILSEVGGFYLSGYWQSEKYFVDIENILRAEFRLKERMSQQSLRMADEILRCNSVCMHVRRGDYVSNPKVNSIHGVCEREYYYRCADRIAATEPDPRIFIFSDDMGWVIENLRLPYKTTHVTHNGAERDYEDLHLMSLCKHHVIANSSFSWWGAWLARRPGQIVIAPTRWFRSPAINTSDLTPKEWIRI
jgi:hypothetical protein